jgi:hypothetical protein
MVKVRTVCIPSSDIPFQDLVKGTMARDPSISSPADLENALRDEYPEVRVRPRELAGQVDRIWYVYRNGVGFAAPGER